MLRFLRATKGAAALEFALWLGILVVPTLNVVDLGYYGFQYIQVRQAAGAAAQAAETTCGPTGLLPAVQQCTGLSSAMTAAAQTTSLGTNVTVNTASTASWEGYYCSNGSPSGGLTVVDDANGNAETWSLSAKTFPTAPSDCSGAVASNTNTPGDYIVITTNYTFHPLFSGVSVAALLNSTITSTSWMRLG